MTAKNKLLLYSLFLSILILLYAPKGKSAELTLATISTDAISDTFSLIIDVDKNTDSVKSILLDRYLNNKNIKRETISVESFIQNGINLKNNLAKIQSNNFLPGQGGVILIDAVYNVLSGKRLYFEVELAKDQNTWHLYSKGRAISQIFAKAHKIPLIGIVGAEELIMQ